MARLRPGELVDDRYEVRALVGEGGMGAVYRALDRTRAVEVALKVVRPELAHDLDLQRFLREAELAARVDRLGGLVRVHASGVHAAAPYYVMELVPGRDLGALLAAKALDERALAALVEGVARTLAACHAAGVVHRDVKPSNIVVDEGGSPRLLDFGLARDLHRETRLTASGEVVGTPAYMAPEQVAGGQVDGRADVYALGAILYHGLAGRPPFEGPLVQLLNKKLTRDPPPPSSLRDRGAVSPALEAICARAMARSPAARHASADALADDLGRWRRGESVPDGSPRRAARLALVAVVVALAALGGTLAWRTVVGRRRVAAALEWDGSRCLADPGACAGGSHTLVLHALGLGAGPAPALAEVDAHLAILEAMPPAAHGSDVAVTHERLRAWARLLDPARGPVSGPTGTLVEALLLVEATRLDEATARLAAAARTSPVARERPLVVARVAVAALRRGPDPPAVRAFVSSLIAAGEAPVLDASAAPGLVAARRAALSDDAVAAVWAQALDAGVRRGPDEVARHLQALTMLLGRGPPAPEAERAWLVRLGAPLGSSLATEAIRDDELELGLRLERALRALAPELGPWGLEALVSARLGDAQRKGVPPPATIMTAALAVATLGAKGLAVSYDVALLTGRLPAESRALRFVRLMQLRDRDPATRHVASREVLRGTVDDLGAPLLASAHLALVEATTQLSERRAPLPSEDVAEALASTEAFRRLSIDHQEVTATDVLTALDLELSLRCYTSGWSAAPAVRATLDGWLDQRLASPGARGAEEWGWVRPRLWVAWANTFSGHQDLSTAPALADLAEGLARRALEGGLDTNETSQARGLLVRVLRTRGRRDEAERLVRLHLEPATWAHVCLPAEAVRTLIDVDLGLAQRVLAEAERLFPNDRDNTLAVARRELRAALDARRPGR